MRATETEAGRRIRRCLGTAALLALAAVPARAQDPTSEAGVGLHADTVTLTVTPELMQRLALGQQAEQHLEDAGELHRGCLLAAGEEASESGASLAQFDSVRNEVERRRCGITMEEWITQNPAAVGARAAGLSVDQYLYLWHRLGLYCGGVVGGSMEGTPLATAGPFGRVRSLPMGRPLEPGERQAMRPYCESIMGTEPPPEEHQR